MTRFSIHAFPIRVYHYMCSSLILHFHWFPNFPSCLLVNASTCMPESHHLIIYTLPTCARHLALIFSLTGLLLTTLDLHVQILERGSWWTSCWSEWRRGSIVDQRLTVRVSFLRDPPPLCSTLEFLFCNSCASFVLFILIYLLVFLLLRLRVMLYACNIMHILW